MSCAAICLALEVMHHVVQQEGVRELAAMGSDEKHLIALEQGESCAEVVLRVDCTADDVLDAYVHAYMTLHAKQPLVGSLQLPDAFVASHLSSSALQNDWKLQYDLAERTLRMLCTLQSTCGLTSCLWVPASLSR